MLEASIFALIHEADKAIVEVDGLITDLSGSVLKFKDFPKRVKFDMQLDAELLLDGIRGKFKQQVVEFGVLEKEVAALQATSRAEGEMFEVLQGRVDRLGRRFGDWDGN